MKEFPIDRIEVPIFYVLKDSSGERWELGDAVYTATSPHFDPEYLCVGVVSAQTPLGQGIGIGYRRERLVEATTQQVLAALRKTHPHGFWFRPHCPEELDLGFMEVMSSAIVNYTADNPTSGPPMIPFTKAQLIAGAEPAIARYHSILRRWWWITFRQRRAIQKALTSQTPS